MPGAMEHVEGTVREYLYGTSGDGYFDVEGLQDIFEKWLGKRVSITVEEVDE
jgi:hypothetical protein